jgi:hypothetical protein
MKALFEELNKLHRLQYDKKQQMKMVRGSS